MTSYRPVNPNQPFPELEEEVLKRWQESDVFHRSIEQRQGGERYTFYEGPPTANGQPGSHHVLSRVFKDVFPRYKTMCGYYVPRKAGWDCHGLPVELEIERQLDISSKEDIEEFGIAEFNQKCRDSVFAYVEEWNKLTERIGFWIDLDDPYKTLDNNYIESVWWSLKKIHDAGRLYQSEKIVPYCPRCGTALSSHEVALGYKDVSDPSVYVTFPLVDDPETSLLVWTTTPWTLIANTAAAVSSDIDYVTVETNGRKLIVAQPLLVEALGEGADFDLLDGPFKGSDLVGKKYVPPFDYLGELNEKAHHIYAADFVTIEDGTGIVHLAPAFGQDDLTVAQEHDLPVVNPVKTDGTYSDEVKDFLNVFVKEADPQIIEKLDRDGNLFRSATYRHSYPHCWRCETPLLYYAKSSWYIKTTDVRDQMLAENNNINWHPEHIKEGRFGKWLESNIDWALSRERYWGTPLPIWHCESGGHIHCVGSVEELEKLAASPLPESIDLHRPYIDDVLLKCPLCDGTMKRVPEVIDAWYDSGSMPFAQWHYPFENKELFEGERFPADFICEAIDQTRGWFYSLLAVSTLLFGETAYKNVLCLGLILDQEGQKMSKSRGNVVAPWEVIDKHGADALRWYYLTSQAPWSGYRFSVEAVGESVRKYLLTLWNTYSFYVLYANIESFDPAQHDLPISERPEIDRWIISRLNSTVQLVRERLDDYDTTNAGCAIESFVDQLSNWYVRLNRRRFWRGIEEPGAFLTLNECLTTLAKLVAPFTPFVADEIFTNLTDDESVHLADYPMADDTFVDKALEFEMATVTRAVELGRAARAKAKIKMRQPLATATAVTVDPKERKALENLAALLKGELNVKSIEFVADIQELTDYQVKPNFKTLGPRFGKQMPAVAAAVSALEGKSVAKAIEDGQPLGISINGNDHSLSPDDISLVIAHDEALEVSDDQIHAVALDTELSDELRKEGLAREVVHAVQAARKNAGFEVEDRINLSLAGDPKITEAAEQFADFVKDETLATQLSFSDGNDGHQEETAIDGCSLKLSVEKSA